MRARGLSARRETIYDGPRMSSRPVLLVTALAALLTASCGGSREATEKQLGQLRAEIVKLRADQAVLTERLDNVELSRGTFGRGDRSKPTSGADAAPSNGGAAPAAGSRGGGDPDRPALDVVHLGPEAASAPSAPTGEAPAGEAEDTDSNAPRPVVKLSGDGKSGGSGPSGSKKAPAKANTPKKKQP